MNIAIFSSHEGSDTQAIIDACKVGTLSANVSVVISNNKDSRVLIRAKKEKIPCYYLSVKEYDNEDILAKKILSTLEIYKIDIIFLAGYLRKLHPSILAKYPKRIFNIHPALLPKYGGKGMYGKNVHMAVINSSDTETGVTIHRVTEEYDSGEIVAQKVVPRFPSDTVESLAQRVLDAEHKFIVQTLDKIISRQIPI